MNTKKILAFALVGTTAFSMFGSVLSVGAASSVPVGDYYDSYKSLKLGSEFAEYTVGTVTGTPNGTPTVDGTFAVVKAEAQKMIHVDMTTKVQPGYIYLYDYKVDKDTDSTETKSDARKKAKSLISNGLGAVSTYWDGSNLTDLNTALNTGWFYDSTAGNSGIEYTVQPTLFNSSDDRVSAFNTFKAIYDDIKGKFNVIATYTLKTNTWYNEDDYNGYNVAVLFQDIAKTYDAVTSANSQTAKIATSQMVYLTQEYNRIIKSEIGGYDNATKELTYETLLENAKALVQADYANADWTAIQKKIYDAEYQYGVEKKLDDAIATLEKVFSDHTAKAGDYSALQSALMSLFDDTRTTSLKASGGIYYNLPVGVTPGSMASEAVYDIKDFQTYSGVPTVAYRNFAIESTPYVDRTGAVLNGQGAFGVAWALYNEASTYGMKVAQSRINAALGLLNDAVEALNANTSAPSWTKIQLEEALDFGAGLVETDFRTTSKVWKDFQTALTKAEVVSAKTSPSATEIKTVTTNLVTALTDLANSSKGGMITVPYSVTKQLRDKVKEGEEVLENLESQSGAQYLALDKALKAVSNGTYISSFDNIKFTNANGYGLISDCEDAMTAIDDAINYFAQPQGWYKTEDGKNWMYGEDDGYVTGAWLKDGATWYYLDENGLAIQGDWKMIEGTWYYFNSNAGAATGWAKVGGKWYFFDQGCKMKTGWVKSNGSWYYLKPVSGEMVTGWAQINGKYYYFNKTDNALGAMGQMVVNTTIDGYKIDANGVWVK